MSNARRNGAIVGLVICTLAWAGNALVARATAGMLPPIGLSFWRWLTALNDQTIGCGVGCHGLLEQAIEQLAPAAPVEAKHKLVEVVVETLLSG